VGRTLVARYGSLVRRRTALGAEAIIGWNLERSFFQRRAGLATLVATTAAGRQSYEVADVEVDEALRVAEALLPGLLEPFLAAPRPLTPDATSAAPLA
jgi:putative membrane protein